VGFRCSHGYMFGSVGLAAQPKPPPHGVAERSRFSLEAETRSARVFAVVSQWSGHDGHSAPDGSTVATGSAGLSVGPLVVAEGGTSDRVRAGYSLTAQVEFLATYDHHKNALKETEDNSNDLVDSCQPPLQAPSLSPHPPSRPSPHPPAARPPPTPTPTPIPTPSHPPCSGPNDAVRWRFPCHLQCSAVPRRYVAMGGAADRYAMRCDAMRCDAMRRTLSSGTQWSDGVRKIDAV
jgi:hypothetical protein